MSGTRLLKACLLFGTVYELVLMRSIKTRLNTGIGPQRLDVVVKHLQTVTQVRSLYFSVLLPWHTANPE